jgi:hypothetical protein
MPRRVIDASASSAVETNVEAGQVITVVYAAQKFSPISYQTFDVGPLSMTTSVQPGETLDQSHARAWNWLKAKAKAQFVDQLADFLDNVRAAGAAVKGGK